LAALRLVSHVPVIAHVEMHALGGIAGAAETFLQVLMSQVDTLMMPVFTYRTMVIPAAGPENNGMRYNRSHGSYSHAELFDPHMRRCGDGRGGRAFTPATTIFTV